MKWLSRFAHYGWGIAVVAVGIVYCLMRGSDDPGEGRIERARREVRAVSDETAAKVTKAELGAAQALADIHAKHEKTVKKMRADDAALMDELERDPVRLARFIAGRR